MIKLHWYALTKPHVVHRYYRIKDTKVKTRVVEDYIVYRCSVTGRPLYLSCLNNWPFMSEYMDFIYKQGGQVLPWVPKYGGERGEKTILKPW